MIKNITLGFVCAFIVIFYPMSMGSYYNKYECYSSRKYEQYMHDEGFSSYLEFSADKDAYDMARYIIYKENDSNNYVMVVIGSGGASCFVNKGTLFLPFKGVPIP